MKQSVVSGLVIALAAVAASPSALAQATEDQLVGGWQLVSLVNQDAGRKMEPFGPNPTGYAVFEKNGNFVQFFSQSGSRKKIVSGNRLKTTPEESEEVAHATLAYFGTWKLVDPKTGEISQHIIGSSFPNWIGEDMKRFMNVKGDSLTVTTPTTALGSGKNTSTYKRSPK